MSTLPAKYGVNPLAWAGNAKLQRKPDMTIEYAEKHNSKS